MRYIAILFCILLSAALAAPASGFAAPADETPGVIDVTSDPTAEPTTERTTEPTKEPTTERTAERTTERTKEPTTEPPTASPTASPGPQVGWITIASTPSGASATLDGRSVGVTPSAGIEVGAGTSHTVRVTMSGYEAYESAVSVSAGGQAAVDATLKPIVTPTPTTEPTITIGPIGGDKGWFRINCNVNGARALLDNGASGSCTVSGGSCSIEVPTTGTPVSSYTVEKGGYTTVTNPVSQHPAKGGTIDLYATLNPIVTPTYGSIQVTSSPSGATASLDGLSWQYTPCTFSALSAGTNHQVQVSMSGYQTFTTTVTVPSDQTAYVSASLTPTHSQPGSLYVTTMPSGADIYVDGRYIAESPSTVPGLSPGSHSVRLHKAGYDEYVSTATVSSGRQTSVTVTLSPQQSNVGSIEVASTPGGSALYLDTHYMGQTPLSGYFDLTSLAPGTHTVLLRHADYQDYTQSISVPAGGSITVNAAMVQVVPGPTPDATGQVVIASSPSGAEVLIDNVYRGVTPVTLSDISSGSHVLTLRLSGYSDAVQTIAVTGGQSTPVAVTLTGVTPAPTKSPLTVVTVIGAFVALGAVLVLGRR